jgi:hypothetical protein
VLNRQHVGRAAQRGDINAEIERQQASVAHAVAGAGQVFPVSAQKALVGKINHDVPLQARSRLHARCSTS